MKKCTARGLSFAGALIVLACGESSPGGSSGSAGSAGQGGTASGTGGGGGFKPDVACDGAELGEEQRRTRYASEEVGAGESCVSEEQTRSCTEEGWSAWSGVFIEETCSVLPGAACGETPHHQNAERVRYQVASVEYGETCAQETQTARCENGKLAEWSGTYTFGVCTVGPAEDCEDGAHGEVRTRTRYRAEAAAWNAACQQESQSQTCEDGTWGDWTGSYTYESCQVTPPVDCAESSHGTTLTRERYQAETVPYGQTCQKEVQSQTCTNGSWGEWSGTYAHTACTVAAPASCDDGVAHGDTQSRIRYQTPAVHNQGACAEEEQTRTCNNGMWGAWTGTYTYPTCSPTAGSCTFSTNSVTYACSDFVGYGYNSSIELSCPGTFSYGHCATNELLLGICTTYAGTATEVKTYRYLSPNFPNLESAQMNCSTGIWTPAP